jgi:peptide-methionine (R)-S-oxide reductase
MDAEEPMRHGRRTLLATAAALAGLSGTRVGTAGTTTTPAGRFEVELDEAEWRRRLSPEQFQVLRKHATERAGTSPLDRERRAGRFHCAGCDRPLFESATKYDSGTGWPSFWAPMDGAVGTQTDRNLFFQTRTEVHCARCGGHLGHVFDDGPRPTGKRYCMNGAALTFRPVPAGAGPQS